MGAAIEGCPKVNCEIFGDGASISAIIQGGTFSFTDKRCTTCGSFAVCSECAKKYVQGMPGVNLAQRLAEFSQMGVFVEDADPVFCAGLGRFVPLAEAVNGKLYEPGGEGRCHPDRCEGSARCAAVHYAH